MVDGSDRFSIQWRWVSAVLLALLIACAATLVVVVAVEDVEILSTVALLLAVLAFAAQLVSSLAQGISSGRQLSEAQRIHNDTHGLLKSIEASTTGLRGTIEKQFDTVLDRAVNSSVSEAFDETTTGEVSPEQLDELRSTIVSGLRGELLPILDDVLRAQNRIGSSVRNPTAQRPLQTGDLVAHPKHGRGKVVDLVSRAGGLEAVIDFDDEDVPITVPERNWDGLGRRRRRAGGKVETK